MSDIVRFSVRQRAEHLFVMVLFTVLVITGMRQKYFEAELSAQVVHALGGVASTRLLHRAAGLAPGQLIPAARVAHSQEGLMAFLVVIVWHVYNALLGPDVFPFDSSIFTGRISRHRMLEE
ncbi:MAG TPA: hypothetical protein VFP52_01055, partial [Myxococcales bacterium]|nr:hypothetical protein [Myxococcales bacterium]